MGSWSVCCGISNIAITSGNKCVLLPIKEDKYREGGKYCPATLPIFGEYDDYGRIENIEKDDNTKFIEDHFGISIKKFCEYLVDGKFTYDRDEVKPILKVLKKNKVEEEIGNFRFMWIDRQVYDFMKINHDEYHKGYMDYGTPEMLALLGFKFIEKSDKFKNYDPKRFNQLWKKGNLKMYSDGSTILTTKNRYVYHFGHGDETSIETYFEVPKELEKLKGMTSYEAWRYGKRRGVEELKYILGERYGDDVDYEELLEALRKERIELKGEPYVPLVKIEKFIHKKYLKDLDTFGDRLAELINVRQNLYPMSGRFSPHELYLTPQCGEYKQHQVLLEKFAEINKSYIEEDAE